MAFLYETHMHTCQVSACGVSTGKEHVHFYRDAGYTGIIMTDHFFRGNTAVDRELPWKDRINWLWSGYEDAKAEGDKVGLDVFFGLEQNFAGDEYLVYGLTKEYMMEHPEMEHWTRRQQLEEVHRAGGCVIQAHPFRIRGYMDRIRIGTAYSDGIEAANAGNEPLDKHQDRAVVHKRRAKRAGSENSEALQKADQAESAADDQAARHTHRHDRNGHGNHVEGDRKAHGHGNVDKGQNDQNRHQHGQQRHPRDLCASCCVCHKNTSVRVHSGYPS